MQYLFVHWWTLFLIVGDNMKSYILLLLMHWLIHLSFKQKNTNPKPIQSMKDKSFLNVLMCVLWNICEIRMLICLLCLEKCFKKNSAIYSRLIAPFVVFYGLIVLIQTLLLLDCFLLIQDPALLYFIYHFCICKVGNIHVDFIFASFAVIKRMLKYNYYIAKVRKHLELHFIF
jgi:hypothetical protein